MSTDDFITELFCGVDEAILRKSNIACGSIFRHAWLSRWRRLISWRNSTDFSRMRMALSPWPLLSSACESSTTSYYNPSCV
jgi:hypothetical protein